MSALADAQQAWLDAVYAEGPEAAGDALADQLDGGPAPLATVCDLEITPLASAPRFVRGDCDGDSSSCSGVNDALTLLSWLFLGRTEPPCLAACDPDGNGKLELADAVYSLNFCFTGTEAPVAPFPGCADGTESDSVLGCANSTCEAATF